MNIARVSGCNGVFAATRSFSAAAAGTRPGMPWKGTPSPASTNAGTPNRLPFSVAVWRRGPYGGRCAVAGTPAVRGSSGSGPAMTSSAIAASPTVRAIGPVLSSSQSSGAMPAMLTRPRVG